MEQHRIHVPVDQAQSRRHFDRAARSYTASAKLEAEVAARMLGRLDYLRLVPARVLDAGCGPGRDLRTLARRYAGAQVLGLDFSLAMLLAGRTPHGWLAALFGLRGLRAVCADLAALPFAQESFDLVWSNLALHWMHEPAQGLVEFRRVLRPGGLLMFTMLGPDTLLELREVAPGRTHAFPDMHDVGDWLVQAGFSAPVMDMERITLSYPDTETLMRDLRATGQMAALASRVRGLGGRSYLNVLKRHLGERAQDGRINVTAEIVYGHAWIAEQPRRARATDGVATIDLSALRRRTS
jgi:malonyl-CoA O-methyltransferase